MELYMIYSDVSTSPGNHRVIGVAILFLAFMHLVKEYCFLNFTTVTFNDAHKNSVIDAWQPP